MNLQQLNRAAVYISKEFGGNMKVLLDTGTMSEEGYESAVIIAVEKTLTGDEADIVILWDDSAFINGLGVESRFAMGIRFTDEGDMQVVKRPDPGRSEFEVVPA